MGTFNYNWPLPTINDAPDGPAQIAALGQAADATVRTIDLRYTAGQQIVQVNLVTRALASGSELPISFDTKIGNMGTISGGTILQAVPAGMYMIGITATQGVTSVSTTVLGYFAVKRNPAGGGAQQTLFSAGAQNPASNSYSTYMSGSCMVRVTAGDTFEVKGFTTSAQSGCSGFLNMFRLTD